MDVGGGAGEVRDERARRTNGGRGYIEASVRRTTIALNASFASFREGRGEGRGRRVTTRFVEERRDAFEVRDASGRSLFARVPPATRRWSHRREDAGEKPGASDRSGGRGVGGGHARRGPRRSTRRGTGRAPIAPWPRPAARPAASPSPRPASSGAAAPSPGGSTRQTRRRASRARESRARDFAAPRGGEGVVRDDETEGDDNTLRAPTPARGRIKKKGRVPP